MILTSLRVLCVLRGESFFGVYMHSYLTADIPGIGGVIKDAPEDFVVEELPAYAPSGAGEHCFLTIEKRGITTLEAIRRLARRLNVTERDVGYAGMKDAVGVTRQTISLPRIKPEDVAGREVDGIRILSAARHTNKLKLGHLKGNRFRIRVAGVSSDVAGHVSAILAVLELRGVPNWFGSQRYGAQANSHLIGAAMLRGDWRGAVELLIGEPEAVRDEQWRSAIEAYRRGEIAAALRLMPGHCRSERDVLQRLTARPDGWEKAFSVVHPRLRKLYLSACQSSLFDRVVESRLTEIDRIMAGDLAWKHANGACFLVEDVAAETQRAAQFEISATGPMFGCKMTWPAGAPRELEQRILAAAGLEVGQFDLGSGLRMEGERRPLRVPLTDVSHRAEAESLVLEFSLPKGSYATTVLREITKTF